VRPPASRFARPLRETAKSSCFLNSDTACDLFFERMKMARRKRTIDKAALDHVVLAPLGWYIRHQAWRKNVSGIVPGPSRFFWGVSKAA